MEKNIVVYESRIGTPFVLKPVGHQVLMLNPGMELTTLEVNDVNWTGLDKDNNGECNFCYLGMTGEEVSGNNLFAMLMLNFSAGIYMHDDAHELIGLLARWGISCPFSCIYRKVDFLKKYKSGYTEYYFCGDGFSDFVCSAPEYIAEVFGEALLLVSQSQLYPEIVIDLHQGDFDEAEFEVAKAKLERIVEKDKNIVINYMKKEV